MWVAFGMWSRKKWSVNEMDSRLASPHPFPAYAIPTSILIGFAVHSCSRIADEKDWVKLRRKETKKIFGEKKLETELQLIENAKMTSGEAFKNGVEITKFKRNLQWATGQGLSRRIVRTGEGETSGYYASTEWTSTSQVTTQRVRRNRGFRGTKKEKIHLKTTQGSRQ